MSKRYTSGVVSSTSPTVNAAGASGVFTLNQQSTAQSTNNWPPYKIEKSLRFRSSASAYLNRTPSVAGNQKIFTISFWAKIGNLGTYRSFFSAGTANPPFVDISLQNTDEFQVDMSVTAGRVSPKTTALFRDPSAWYHFVVAFDTTQATQANRVKVYVNGVQQTLSALGVAQNTDLAINSAVAHNLGRRAVASDSYHEGYMSEINFIDGQALTPSSFGATDKDGNWSPIAYTGNYGNNGFYLNFKDATSTSTVGYDYSGNGNNWASSGISVTAGTTYDSMIDVPEDQSDGTANNRGNYCTLNPLANPGIGTLSDGNLRLVTSTNSRIITGTMALPSTGQYYFEITATDYVTGGGTSFGVVNQEFLTGAPSNGTWLGISTYNASYQNGTTTDTNNLTGTDVTNDGDIWCFAIDVTNNKFWVGRSRSGTLVWADGVTPAVNGSGATTISLPTGTLYPMAYRGGSYNETYDFNFGQRPFAYAPPTGFKALNTFNLPEPTIKQPNKHFDITLWTGNGGTQSVTNSGSMQPNLVWIKNRTGTNNHALFDSVRGATLRLYTDSTLDEQTEVNTLTAFNSNGFSLGSGAAVNAGSNNYVGWQWRASNAAGVSNTSGSIASTVSVNPTAGFSIVTYTGNGGTSDTIGHGLGVTPSMIIIKVRSNALRNWHVYHASLGSTRKIFLNLTDADTIENGNFGGLSPTATTFGVGYAGTNGSAETFVAYCFAPIAGYSAFGSYTGNASTDGPFVYTGFRPRFIMIKRTTSADPWIIHDTARDIYNGYSVQLYPNSNSAEAGPYSPPIIDELSNGFKCRSSASGTNGSGDTFIYMAFAEMPFKYARAR